MNKDRTEINQQIVRKLLLKGVHPSVAKVLKEGGKGSTQNVQQDVSELLVRLAQNEEKPTDIPEAVYEVARLAIEKAWESLSKYHKKSDDKVKAAQEEVRLSKATLTERNQQIDDLSDEINKLQLANKELDRALASEKTRVTEISTREENLNTQLNEMRLSYERELKNEQEHRARLIKEYDLRLEEFDNHNRQLRKNNAERLAAENVRFEEMSNYYAKQFDDLKTQNTKLQRGAEAREQRLNEKINSLQSKYDEATRDVAALKASVDQQENQNLQLTLERDKLSRRLEEMSGKLALAQAENDTIKADKDRIKVEKERVKSELSEANKKLKRLQAKSAKKQ